jgi:hypothetical protein
MKYLTRFVVLLMLSGFVFGQIPHTVPPGTNDSFVFRTGNDLLRDCRNVDELRDTCAGYVLGAVDLIGSLQGSSDINGTNYWKYRSICMPKNAEAGQIKDIIVKYLVEHPEKRDEPAAQLIIITMLATWGCPKK